MSTLDLVRHGQASFLADDYDVLSPLGEQQAAELGAYYVKQQRRIDRLVAGPRRRQRDTAEILRATCVEAGMPVPEIVTLPELDEYQAEELMKHHAHEIVREHSEVSGWLDDFQRSKSARERMRSFEILLQGVMRLWIAGAIHAPKVEDWSAFRRRVSSALQSLTEVSGKNKTVVAVSSGGAIGTMVAELLGVGDETALELGWALNNASVTELRFSGDRRSLLRFNSLAHLAESASWTHR